MTLGIFLNTNTFSHEQTIAFFLPLCNDNTHSIVDIENLHNDYDLSANSAYVQELATLLRKTYVCGGSNQTVYDYFYDSLYTTLVGSSSASGTYFLSLEYQWLHNLNEQNKVEIIEKMDYDALINSLA